MAGRFQDRVAVVTGSAGGLGRSLALGYAREGAKLILLDVDAAGLEQTRRLVEDVGSEAATHVLDLSDERQIAGFGADLCADEPRIDILFNNAGIAYGAINGGVDAADGAQWSRYLAVNALAPLLMARALRPALGAARGVILNMSSMASFAPSTIYGVTKAALNALTYGMADAFGADGIRVNGIAPGLIETPASSAQVPQATWARIRGMQQIDRPGTPEDIVALALFLSSAEAGFMTGDTIACDAGNRVRGWLR